MKYRNYSTTQLLVIDAGRDYEDPELADEICRRVELLKSRQAKTARLLGECLTALSKTRRDIKHSRTEQVFKVAQE